MHHENNETSIMSRSMRRRLVASSKAKQSIDPEPVVAHTESPTKKVVRIYFLRHAESVNNICEKQDRRRLGRRADPTLSTSKSPRYGRELGFSMKSKKTAAAGCEPNKKTSTPQNLFLTTISKKKTKTPTKPTRRGRTVSTNDSQLSLVQRNPCLLWEDGGVLPA